MKILVFIIALILAFSGCTSKNEPVLPEEPNIEDVTVPDEPEEKSIFTANAVFLNDCNEMEFPEDKVFLSVPETDGNLYIVPEFSGDSITRNDQTHIGPATLYYKNSAGKAYTLSYLPVYDFQDPRISLVHLTEDIYSLCTPEKIMFFALESNMQIDFTLDFQKTDHLYHGFNCVTYDEVSKTYLLIFSVSDYKPDNPSETPAFHRIWNDESASLCFQRFASDGSYIDTTETDIPLIFLNTLSSCCPNNYTGDTVEFFRRPHSYSTGESYYHYNFKTGELVSLPARDFFVSDDFTVIRSEWNHNGETDLFEATYSLLEHGKESSVLKISAELDFHINESNYEYNFPHSVSMDADNETLKVRYGRAVHSLDFKNEHADFSYDYSGLTEEDIFAKSPDGKYELYCIGNAGRGGEYYSVAAKNTETGKFSYIGEHCFWSYTQFVSREHQLLFRSSNEIKYVDIPTGESGVVINFDSLDEEFLCEAYDVENEIIIVASVFDLHDYPEFDISEEKIKLLLFDFNGNPIDVIETNIIPNYSAKAYGAYLNEMSVNPDGTVTICDFYGIVDPSGFVITDQYSVNIKYIG